MAVNPNWARWIFASLAKHLKYVATENQWPVLVEGFDTRTPDFMDAPNRAEIRITGPFISERSAGYFRVWVDANVLLSSIYGGPKQDPFWLSKAAGAFQEALTESIPVWNYGNEAGDYLESDESTQVFIGCLTPRDGNQDAVSVFNFGQINDTDKLKQSAVNARLVMWADGP